MLELVWLQTIQLSVLAADGHAWKTIPPVEPHPLSAAGEPIYPTKATIEVVSPLIVAVAAVEQLLAPCVPDEIATVVSATKGAVAYPVKAVPFVFVQLIAFEPLVVQSPLISVALIAEELPRTRPVSVLPVPVPPLATGKVPPTSAVSETAEEVTACVLPAKCVFQNREKMRSRTSHMGSYLKTN